MRETDSEKRLKIAVIGGGNIGTQFACLCACKGYSVNVYTTKPEAYDGELEMIDEHENVRRGRLNLVTADMGEAMADCGVVFITHPAFRFGEVAGLMLPYITEDTNICVLPGTGGLSLHSAAAYRRGRCCLACKECLR